MVKRNIENIEINIQEEIDMESVLCPLCSKNEILETNYDHRDIFKCNNCGNVWFTKSKVGGFSMIGDEILEEVIINSESSRHLDILINTIFRNEMGKPVVPYDTQIQKWASAYYLLYNIDRASNEVRFSKEKPIVETLLKQNEIKRKIISIKGLEFLITAVISDANNQYEIIGYNGEKIVPYPKYVADKKDFEIDTLFAYYESGITCRPEYLVNLINRNSIKAF
jgi:hypothetical protein